jgi:hypothetical protein
VPNYVWDRERYPWLTESMVATFSAVCSYTYLPSRASDRYGRCIAGVEAIASRARQTERTTRRNLKELEMQGFIYRVRPPDRGVYETVLVLEPERFAAVAREQGREAAITWYEGHLEDVVEHARVERAVETRSGRNKRTDDPLMHGKDRTDDPVMHGKDRTDDPVMHGKDRTDDPVMLASGRTIRSSGRGPDPVSARTGQIEQTGADRRSGEEVKDLKNGSEEPAAGAAPPSQLVSDNGSSGRTQEQAALYGENARLMRAMLAAGPKPMQPSPRDEKRREELGRQAQELAKGNAR